MEIFCAQIRLQKSYPYAHNNCQDLSFSVGLANCCWIPNCNTKKFLLILPEIFKDYACRYGEHYYNFLLQPDEYHGVRCILPKVWVVTRDPNKGSWRVKKWIAPMQSKPGLYIVNVYVFQFSSSFSLFHYRLNYYMKRVECWYCEQA